MDILIVAAIAGGGASGSLHDPVMLLMMDGGLALAVAAL